MNAHTPFDANQDWTNPYCQNSSNDPMVDALLGNAYHVVRTVYCNLGNLKLIYDFLNQYGMVLGVQSEAELKALTTKASFARIYDKTPVGDRQVTDYLYVEGDRTGILPDDTTATGSWVKVATTGSDNGGDKSNDGGYIPWIYNSGSANGGETTIRIPDETVGAPFMIVNGDWQTEGYDFEYDPVTFEVSFTTPLEPGDFVVVMRTGVPATPDNPNVSDWVTINWLYNQGAAVGGEQVIDIPYTFQSVPAVYKNGLRFYKGLTNNSYTIDSDNNRIILTEPLATNDRLIIQLGGEANILEVVDHTIQEVARSANVKDSQVILSVDTVQSLNGKAVVYDVVAQRIYGLPTLPSNVYINTVANGKLYYNPGNVEVTLLDVPGSGTEVKSALAKQDGLSLIGQCNSIADLRNVEPVMDGQRILVKQHTAGTGKGGGTFQAKLSGVGLTDDNGVTVKTVGGAAWVRVGADRVNPYMYGALGSGNDDTLAVQACLNSGKATNITDVHHVSNVTMNKGSASIYGSGLHYTRLHQLPAAVGSLLTIADTCSLTVIDSLGLYGTGYKQGTAFTTGTRGIDVLTPTGLSNNYPDHTTSDPRRDLVITKVHIAGFDEYGLNVNSGNFSVTTESVLINHIKQVGARCATTDWTWTNIQINTCGKQCLILDGCGNGRIIGGKFIWANWLPYGASGQFPGITINNSQNMVINGIEVQDCGGNGIEFTDSYSISMNGLNTNRNGINSTAEFYNLVFNRSDVEINGFVGLNYKVNSGSPDNSSSGNLKFLSSDCNVTLNGKLETGYMGIEFIGDTRVIQPTSSYIKLNGLVNYAGSGIQTINEVPTFDGVSTTPVYVPISSVVGQTNGLRLSQANKDKVIYTRKVGPEGVTMAAVITPTIGGAEIFNLMAIGTGFSSASNSLYFQLEIAADGSQNVSLLLSGDGTTQILSGTLPAALKLQSGEPYHVALGAKAGYFWWSILNLNTGKRIRRSFRGAYLPKPFASIFGLVSSPVFFSGAGIGDSGCSGVGAKIYLGSFSDENDYVSSRYYSLVNPVDPTKMYSFRILDSTI